MSEHDVDKVVDRVTAEVNEIEFFGAVNRARVGIILDHLRPGDRLPGGLVVVQEVDPTELSEIAAEIRAGRKSPNEARFVYRLPPVEDSEDKP